MKTVFRLALVAGFCATLHGLSAALEVNVSASRAVRIALIDTQTRAGVPPALEAALNRHFSRTISQLYGAETAVEFVHLDGATAASRLQQGRVDSAIVLGARLPTEVRRLRLHILRAESTAETGGTAAALVLCRADAKLDELLANAFSIAVDDAGVREALTARLRGAPSVAAATP